ncbi:MAG: peptidylprolyl isomerase [Proteobacteria bacterium]|jgi:peptidylprolyl isomerase|nr:peptidylprolyl isomerase [Pseudomonadota bacterium]
MGQKAKKGDRAKVHYTGTLDDGTTFDSSRQREPIEITLGAKQVIKGFDKALRGMGIGDVKKVAIPCEEAYGIYQPKHVAYVARDQLPPNLDFQPGMVLEVKGPDGGARKVIVKEIQDDAVVLDGNHPLAGQRLTFELELMDLVRK